MRTINLKIIGILCLILGNFFFLATCSTIAVNNRFSNSSQLVAPPEYLLKRALLFGRFDSHTIEENYSTLEAINLRIVFFQPFQIFHFINREPISFTTQDQGMLLLDSFALGGFTVIFPINNNSIAVMNTTMGTLLVELYEDKMPNTTANFIRLADDGFYDGLVFHRVIENFVIQGGGYYPNGTLKISPYGPIDLEIHPAIHHLDGTIGMARTNDPNSATSQFFIDDGAQPRLEPGGSTSDGYAAFGRVVKGIEVVRAIAQVETMTKYGGMDDWPVEDIIIEDITIVHP
ncbi:MAG: peptidylprolyl isomerase [Candidatus Thermoplasmatota archaeon]|nr:peptidylprolyl isomerase [Candidatus Thermoplasmatota archaeon]